MNKNKGDVPPLTVRSTDPFEPPLQLTLICVVESAEVPLQVVR